MLFECECDIYFSATMDEDLYDEFGNYIGPDIDDDDDEDLDQVSCGGEERRAK